VITHIDVSIVLQRTVCALYSNLVTRPTGVAVRTEIEQQLAASRGSRTLTVMDFTNVGLLDYSCADEVVAKLLLRFAADESGEAYFLFSGIAEAHLDAIEPVLERHRLALIALVPDGEARLIGEVSNDEQAAWLVAYESGPVTADGVAQALDFEEVRAAAALQQLRARHLIMETDAGFVAVGSGALRGVRA
jgi:hypothetical protein